MMLRRPTASRLDRRLFCAGAAAAVIYPSVAGAYLLPERFILKKMATHLKRRPVLQVTLTGRAVVGKQVMSVGERWMFDQRQKTCQVDVNGTGGAKVSWRWQKGQPLSGITEGEAGLLPTEVERLTLGHLVAFADPVGLLDALQVDRSTVRLGLLKDRAMYVIGAGPREPGLPQVWIDQDRFTVAQVRYQDGAGRLVQLSCEGWWGPPRPGVFPGRLRVQVGRTLMRQVEVSQIKSPIQEARERRRSGG
ncbi:MAG: hypothetical protein ACE366_21555 [Bradymonadia bacterium]